MGTKLRITAAAMITLITANGSFSQELTPIQKEVWQVCEKSWKDYQTGNIEGIGTYLHPNYQGWDDQSSLPNSKEKSLQQIKQWLMHSKIDSYEIEPARIAVAKDAAVVDYHYHYSVITDQADKKEIRNYKGKFVEYYVRDGNHWLLLGDSDFINKRISNGLPESTSDFEREAMRQFEQRGKNDMYRSVLENLARASKIDSMAQIVLVQSYRDICQDLTMIITEMTSVNEGKAMIRELIAKVNSDIATNAGQKNKQPPLDFSTGMGSEEAYHKALMPVADPQSGNGLKLMATDLFPGYLEETDQLKCVLENLKGKLDSLNEISEINAIRLQLVMERRSLTISALSNIMKMFNSTQENLIQNLK